MSRLQLALNVNDIDEAVNFYAKLFGTEPAKRKPGYANFAITEPPLKLVLLENPGQGGSSTTSASKFRTPVAVEAEQARLAEAGLTAVEERDTTCCYARQDKFWATGALGSERWEIYTVLADSPTFWGQDGERRGRHGPGRTPQAGRPPNAAAARKHPARTRPPPPAPAADSRQCEHASQSPRRCHRWTARPRAGRCRGSCQAYQARVDSLKAGPRGR